MAVFKGVVTMGSLRRDGASIRRPHRPWLVDLSLLKPFDFVPAGDIAEFEPAPDFARWALGDTPAAADAVLRWIEIDDSGRTLLVCDRMILVRVSWDDLHDAGYVHGREVSIDGHRYLCRLLSGGTGFGRGEDGYSGGAPANEWDRIVGGQDLAGDIPPPLLRTLADGLDPTALHDAHNRLWNWFGAVSWTREPYVGKPTARVCRGYHAANFFYLNTQSHRHEDIGWRPVLEPL